MNINFQKPSTLTDGMVRSFVKACFLDRRIRNGQVSNLPTEIAAILKQQGSPHIELTRVLGIADKMLTGTPLGLFNTVESRAFLKEQLIQFLANCEKDSPAAVEYILSNGTISLYIYHMGGEVSVELENLFPLDSITKETANHIGIHVRDPKETTMKDFVFALIENNTDKLLRCLADVDEVITGSRLKDYAQSMSTKFPGLCQHLEDFVGDFQIQQNVSTSLRYELSDGSTMSHLVLKLESARSIGSNAFKISVDIDSRNKDSLRHFVELKEQGSLNDEYFQID